MFSNKFSTSGEDEVVFVGRRVNPFLIIIAIAFATTALYVAIVPTESPLQLTSSTRISNGIASTETNLEEVQENDDDDDSLDRILKVTATAENRTVIVTTLNSAWSAPGSIIDSFLESFRSGEETAQLLNHVLIVCLDNEAYKRCKTIHPHCYALRTEGVDFSGDKFFMTDGYLLMMWRRIDFLREVLKKGYSFIFSDADIVWFRNPFPRFNAEADFQISCDHYHGDPLSLNNSANGGFNYVKSNKKTVEFYKFWYESRLKYPKQHDQDVFSKIKSDPFVHQQIGLKISFLSTEYFGGFCEPSNDLNKVVTMHANCCMGLENKIHDLRLLVDDWKRFMTKIPWKRYTGRYSWSSLQLNCR